VNAPRRVAVVTGSRADYGLLRPVMHAIAARDDLDLEVLVTGTHMLPPALTEREVEAEFEIAARIEMQRPGEIGRAADATALGRGVSGFARRLAGHPPDVVLVLGDRIEAFAAAAAAAVSGIRVAHLHGGDRAEGIADEGLRHAITKLAHIHLPATVDSTERIIAMGEEPLRTHLVGSPALDDLDTTGPLPDDAYDAHGRPEILVLLHPSGDEGVTERDRATRLLRVCTDMGRTLALDPNFDPGREGIIDAIASTPGVVRASHLPRAEFVGLLRRVEMIVGNSSAGLIECAAIPRRCVNLGRRQGGRRKPPHVIDCPEWDEYAIERAIRRAREEPLLPFRHPYGDGRAGPRAALLLARFEPDNHALAKQNAY